GKENTIARSRGEARGQIAIDPSGRVRSRGNRARSKGQARRAIDQAGDRDRPVEGAPCRGAAPAEEEREPRDPEEGGARARARPAKPRARAVEAALESRPGRARA